VLSPRGEFSPGALRIKPFKKRLYIWLFRFLLPYFQNFCWHATTEAEAEIITSLFGLIAPVRIAPNIPAKLPESCRLDFPSGSPAHVPFNLCFISRICQKKNLHFALRCLFSIAYPVNLSIVGPVEDDAYWRQCLSLISELPPHVSVNYLGPLPHDQVSDFLFHQDLFFLPTLGENFGHIIYESLSHSVPVLISDQTPWGDVSLYDAGWSLALDSVNPFSDCINLLASMPPHLYSRHKTNARNYALSHLSRLNLSGYTSLFSV
jgi:glycosyltransferase involved in cell wall biosynthesis